MVTPPPIVLCVGTEAWLRDDAIRQVAERCVTPALAALDTAVFVAGETDPQAILAAARTPPMANPRRLVVARGPWPATVEALAWLTSYARQVTPSTCLVVELAEPPPAEVRRAFMPGTVREIACHPLKGGAILAWVRQRVERTARKTLTPDAAQLLVARVGHDLGALARALERLALLVGDRPRVTADEVAAVIGWSVEERVFAVVDAVIRQDRATALRITRRLIEEEGVTPEEVLGALGKHLRRLWQVVRRAATGLAPSAAVEAAGVPWHAQEPLQQLVTRMSPADVAAALTALVETDRSLKSGGAPPILLVEGYVWDQAAAVN